ncbi:MAG TPA: DUF4440 domain-containing protein [Pyrinomonadaceae bacterium]|nr:DUF4440 domain-containing protein [Pyrinomonadaceae bacterium]
MRLRKISASLLVLFLALGAAVAYEHSWGPKTAKQIAAIEEEILRLEESGRVKALRGESQWDDLMADGAYAIGGDGTVLIYKKGQNLSSMSLTSFEISELIVRVYQDVVVVTGLSKVAAETPDKKPFSFQMRYMNVWKKSSDGWKIVASERTMVRPYGK